ncbi:MAG: hypothetical protein IJ222_06030 [Bacteroidales bacterium]|nr:hypothetical protein [Bacteroidales bacterium]
MKKLLVILAAAVTLFASCSKEKDPVVENGVYKIDKVLQISDANKAGVDIKPYFDWFDSFALNVTETDGEITAIAVNNGSIPHALSLPATATDCVVENNTIKVNGKAVALIEGGNIAIDFELGGKGVSYRYILKK